MAKKELSQEALRAKDRHFLAGLIDAAINQITQEERYQNYGSDDEPLRIIADSLSVKYYPLVRSRKGGNQQIKKAFRLLCLQQLAKVYDVVYYDDGTVGLPGDTPEDHLRALAEKLSLNLVDVSTALGEVLPYQDILEPERLWKQREREDIIRRERFVAIVGAGASNAATPVNKPIPGTEKAIKKIRAAFDGKLLNRLIDERVKDLSSRIEHAAEDDFELQMKALISFSPEKAIQELKKICGHKNAPSLLYEILAHLLKHRFLDAIVNFNYDELLDNAIEEELPSGEDYNFIYTAGHCPNRLDDLYIGHRIKQPIYVKCHGTISRPNSLRFRETDAFTIEKAIQKHLEELFIAKMPDNSGATQRELPLNLLVFGFGMNNQVFNQLIKKVAEAKTEDITIWIFDTDPDLAKFVMQKLRTPSGAFYRNITVRMITLDKGR